MASLEISLDTVGWIILKAREIDVKDVDTSDHRGDDDDPVASILEDRGDDPSATEVRSWIEDLARPEQAELIALFWLGRGDGDPEEFEELKARAAGWRRTPASSYLLASPMLPDMLEEGLERMGFSAGEILDRL